MHLSAALGTGFHLKDLGLILPHSTGKCGRKYLDLFYILVYKQVKVTKKISR